MVERIRTATSRVEQYPEEPAIVPGTPAHVVEHDGPWQPLGFEEPLHELHWHKVPLVGFGAGDDNVAVAFGASVRVQKSLGEVARRKQIQ